MIAGRYERARGDLPWGWWMRVSTNGLEDGDGSVWPDVRTAFWEGRLGMRSGHLDREQQELLLRVLQSLAAGWLGPGEGRHDLFGGDMMFWRFYMCWLGSIGMLEVPGHATAPALGAGLSEEGRAALLMLRATRLPAFTDLPMAALVDAMLRGMWTGADDAREAALRAFERGVTPLFNLFARERVGRAHLVTLTGIDPRDRMPTRRVNWSVSFLDERSRDDLFGWLAERVHRWDDWGGLARDRGASALTEHLLALLVASPIRTGASSGTAGSST